METDNRVSPIADKVMMIFTDIFRSIFFRYANVSMKKNAKDWTTGVRILFYNEFVYLSGKFMSKFCLSLSTWWKFNDFRKTDLSIGCYIVVKVMVTYLINIHNIHKEKCKIRERE